MRPCPPEHPISTAPSLMCTTASEESGVSGAIEGRDAKPYLQRSNVRSHLHDLGRPQTGSPHTTPAAAPLAAQRLPQVTPGMQADHPDPQAGVSQSTDYARTRTRPLCCAAGQRAALGKTALSHALGCGG